MEKERKVPSSHSLDRTKIAYNSYSRRSLTIFLAMNTRCKFIWTPVKCIEGRTKASGFDRFGYVLASIFEGSEFYSTFEQVQKSFLKKLSFSFGCDWHQKQRDRLTVFDVRIDKIASVCLLEILHIQNIT